MSDLVVRVAADLTKFRENFKLVDNQIDTTASALNRMTSAFDGSKTIANANAAVIAVDKLGGATKLTADEQERLNKILTAGIEQYTKLGKEAPESMLAMQKATEGAGASTRAMAGGVDTGWAAVSRFAGALGIGLGVGALVSFGQGVMDTASKIGDMSEKLGTSTDFAQRMNYVAGQSGTTIEVFGNAINKMNVLLSAGEDSTIEALKRVGLSFDDVRQKKPEEAFLAIADSIRQIPDPMLQAEMALRLFGKAGQELLPAIKGGIEEVSRQTSVMSEETVRRLKAAQDQWEGLKNKGVILTGEAIASFGEYMQTTFVGMALKSGESIDLLREAMNTTETVTKNLGGATSAYGKSLEGILPPLSKAWDKLKEFDDATRESEAAMRKSIAANEAYNASVKSMADEWTGAKLAERVKLYADALVEAGGAEGIMASKMAGIVREIGQFLTQGAQLDDTLVNLYMSHQKFNDGISTGYAAIMKNINMTAKYKDTLLELPPVLTDVVFRSEAVASATDMVTASATRSTAAALTWSEALDKVRAGLGTMGGSVAANTDFSEDKRREIQKAFDEGRYFGPVLAGGGTDKGGGPDWAALGFTPRAMGGPVTANDPYLVGERGPELFVPQSSGGIVPNHALGGMNVTVNLNVAGHVVNAENLGPIIGDGMVAHLRNLGVRLG